MLCQHDIFFLYDPFCEVIKQSVKIIVVQKLSVV